MVRGRTVVQYLNGCVRHQNNCIMATIREEFCSYRRHIPDDISSITTCQQDKTELRVVCYNILSDSYASTDYSKRYLYGYIEDTVYLDSEYRAGLVLNELLHYDADIICLQECDRKVYDCYFRPFLASLGYSGQFTSKCGGVGEGCACFVLDQSPAASSPYSALVLLRIVDFRLKDILTADPALAKLFNLRPDLKDILGGYLSTVAQICICQSRSDPDRILLVGNTHLFYHPAAAYVRLLQTYVVLSVMEKLRDTLVAEHRVDAAKFTRSTTSSSSVNCEQTSGLPDPLYIDCDSPLTVSIIFMGDLNSTPETAVVEYLERGYIDASHEVWHSINNFAWTQRNTGCEHDDSASNDITAAENEVYKGEERGGDRSDRSASLSMREVEKLLPRLELHTALYSAAGLPQFTNYTRGFKDLLDYVYVEEGRFEVTRIAPFPIEEVLAADTALPSRYFPSDHLAVAIDLLWK